ISVVPTLLGQRQPAHPIMYWEFHEGGSKQAVRMGQWKAVRNDILGPIELYNLATDIGETNNVATKNPNIVEQVQQFLKTARTESEHWPLKQAPPPQQQQARPKNR
ncbi:MAG TPA: N-acetylgalactosamine-6-sulfatase, partial [Methylomirabilota bacterium]|nr:N-acetylgalactosamine-6-sulfatase [Methylomirabilota bacterium]